MQKKKSWIAYVGPFLFPWGQPGSRRVCGIARSFADAGYDVVVGSGGAEPPRPAILDEGEEPGSITYLGLGEVPPPGTSLVNKSLQLFMHWGAKTVAWLDSQTNKPSHIVLYGGSAQYMFRLLPWCRRNNVPLIVDVVEWYDARQMTGGFFGPFHISAKIALHYYYPKCDGIIAISSYLAEHYRKHGCPVVTVPPTLDVKNHSLIFHDDADQSRLTLVYAGTPGKKDLLTNIICGIARIDANGGRVRLLVMGPTLEQVKQLLNGSEPPAFVQVLGRIPQTEVAKIVQQSDFSVLLREPLRFAQAGFPTKFVESMSNGTPVIANLTSDLGMYLTDGINGLICRDHSAEAFAETLQRATLLSPDVRKEMRNAARKEAERSFDFRSHTMLMNSFLKNVVAKNS
jgi:glycosyltransferase involved in cell wall biosynthesis